MQKLQYPVLRNFADLTKKYVMNSGMTAHLLQATPGELSRYLDDSALLAQRIHAGGDAPDERRYDIDQSWDGIIYLLTGQNSSSGHPLSKVIFSGQLIDKEQDLGTGPAHYLLPAQVQELHTTLREIQPEMLKARFNAAEMKANSVYPGNAWEQEGTDDYLVEYFELLQEIIAVAARNGDALITFIQ